MLRYLELRFSQIFHQLSDTMLLQAMFTNEERPRFKGDEALLEPRFRGMEVGLAPSSHGVRKADRMVDLRARAP